MGIACNYDSWISKVPSSVKRGTQKHILLAQMEIGVELTRASLYRVCNISPGSGSSSNMADYHLYRMGLLEVVRMNGLQKVFRITDKGLAVLQTLKSARVVII